MKILNQTYDYVKEGQFTPPTWKEIYSKSARIRPHKKIAESKYMGYMFVLIELLI